VDLSGDYTLTLEVGGGCAEVPEELRIRSYAARISFSDLLGSSYVAEVHSNVIGPDLYPEPSPGTYFATSGYGGASVQSSELSTISGQYRGYFKYCTLSSGAGGTDQCLTVTMTYDMCKAENSRWTLTRR
jgi:hypothetical protein